MLVSYYTALNIIQAAYTKKLGQYKASLTPEHEHELLRIKDEKLHRIEQLKFKREKYALGLPRKPASPYLLFVSEQSKNSDSKPAVWYKAKWASLSDDAKKPYFELGIRKQAAYQ